MKHRKLSKVIGIGTIREITYEFMIVFHCNYKVIIFIGAALPWGSVGSDHYKNLAVGSCVARTPQKFH